VSKLRLHEASAEHGAPAAFVGERYELMEAIGSGATSVVYRARDTLTGGEVALQRLSAAPHVEQRISQGLSRIEAALMGVNHPNVVRCLGVGTEEGRTYLVLELLQGETLGQYLEREGRLPLDLALRLFGDAARGLAALHDAGLVHRDVKPDNLFLEGPLGAPTRLRVIDFGLSRMQEAGDAEEAFVAGTLEYIAPEQAVCDPVDARADVYSLGVVLFRALTGELPFEGNAGPDWLAHHVVSVAPPPSWLLPSLPADLDAAVQTALRKHPANRFQSMSEFAAALAIIAEGRDAPRPVPSQYPDRYEAQSDTAVRTVEWLDGVIAAA
jgi:serine/threonine-protein kinase